MALRACAVALAAYGAMWTAAHAESLFLGGDDLATFPMECAADAPQILPEKAYDGTYPTSPKPVEGAIKGLHNPKYVGAAFFASVDKGVQEAAASFDPPAEIRFDGPNVARVDEQIAFVENYVNQDIDGILIASNDGVALAPVLKRALDKGITVVTYDSDVEPDARTWFVNQALHNQVAKYLIDIIAEENGGKGNFAIITSTFNTPVQARWIAEMGAYTAKCYPEMKWLETVEAQEDANLSFNQAVQLINKYGDDLNGLISMTGTGSPAVMQAVQEAGLCGKLPVTGLALPSTVAPYLKSGCAQKAVLWSTEDLGYAATQVMKAVIDGKLTPESKTVEAGRLGELKVLNGSQVLLGNPMVFTKDNVDQFDF